MEERGEEDQEAREVKVSRKGQVTKVATLCREGQLREEEPRPWVGEV